MSSMTFELGLVLPIFKAGDIEIYLKSSGFPLKKNLGLTGFEVQVDTEPLEISVATGLQVNFTNNPTLDFDVKGKFEIFEFFFKSLTFVDFYKFFATFFLL